MSAQLITSNQSEVIATPSHNEFLRHGKTANKIIADNNFINLPIQRKLAVGATNDPLEHEADAMADKVMRMPMQATFSSAQNNAIQRKCNHCEEEENDGIAQRKPLVSFIQKKENGRREGAASDTVTSQINATKGGGYSLDSETQSFMENRFGTGFQDVRIHTGGYASELSQQLQAKAFTVGKDVYFNQNKYAPNTNEGKHLLAHELTHTIQQSGTIQRDKEEPKPEDAEVTQLKNFITAGKWMEAHHLLMGQWMKIMVENKLDALTEPEITALIANADAAMAAKGSMLGEGGKNRNLAGLWAVKSMKINDMPAADSATAVQKAMTIPFDQRLEIINYLSKGKTKGARKLYKTLNKPFLGDTASAYDFSDRFLKHSNELGFDVESNAQTLPKTKWDKDDPDPQTTLDTDTATQSFENSDIVFFSGHQYAQKGRPGLFTNEKSDSCFNISAISKKINKVKLVASTSCATICKDTATIFQAKFPNAMILGYKYSAPSNGEAVSAAFTTNLVKRGAIDLTSASGLAQVRDAWKKVTVANPGKEGQPGVLEGNDIEFYGPKGWQTVKADSKENDCHYH